MDGKDVVAMARTGIVWYIIIFMIIYWGLPQSILRMSFWSFLCVDIQREFAPHLLTTQYKEHYFPASN